MNPIELKALQKTRLNLLENLDVDHVKDHLIQYEVSSIKHRHSLADSNKPLKHKWLYLLTVTVHGDGCVMAYSYCRTRTRIQTQIPNLMGTLYYAEVFTLVRIQIRIPTQMVSQMVTVPILGMDVHPKETYLSQF